MIYGNSTLQRLTTSDGYTDDLGIFHAGTTGQGAELRCDVETNGQAREIKTEDGRSFRYTYVVTMDVDVDAFSVGDRVIINRPGDPVREFEVVGFHRYAFISKLWV